MRTLVVILSVSAVLGSGPVFGQGLKAPPILTLDQAVQEAVENNLDLLAQRYDVAIADARVITARLRPNPVFSSGADYQDVLGSGYSSEPANNAGPPEVNFRVDYLIESAGKRQKRTEVARETRSVTELLLLDGVRQLKFRVQGAYLEAVLAKESLALAKENLAALAGIVEIDAAKVRAGDLAEVELLRSRLAVLQFQNAVRQAELRYQVALNGLRLLLGRTQSSPPFDVTGPFRRDKTVEAEARLRQDALQLRPDLRALDRDRARSAADLRLQMAQGKIDYTVGVQYHKQYGNAQGDALGFFFSTPLPVFNRNQGEIERARQEQEQIAARMRALQASVANEAENAYNEYSAARDQLVSMEGDIIQQAREVRATMDYSYRRGEASLVEFLDAQRAFNDTMQSYNEARASYARALYQMEFVSGKSVNP